MVWRQILLHLMTSLSLGRKFDSSLSDRDSHFPDVVTYFRELQSGGVFLRPFQNQLFLWRSITLNPAMDELDNAIREFSPTDGDWRLLESLFEVAFSSADPRAYYNAIFNLFERFPDEDGAGVFWSALHGMEAIGGYEVPLLGYFRRWPNLMTKVMLQRIQNSGQDSIQGVLISSLGITSPTMN